MFRIIVLLSLTNAICCQSTTTSSTINNTMEQRSLNSTEPDNSNPIRNIFRFILLPKSTTPSTPKSRTSNTFKLGNQNSFVILPNASRIPQQNRLTTANYEETTGTEYWTDVSSYGYITELISTYNPTGEQSKNVTLPKHSKEKSETSRIFPTVPASIIQRKTTQGMMDNTQKTRKIPKSNLTKHNGPQANIVHLPNASLVHRLSNTGIRFIRLPVNSSKTDPSSAFEETSTWDMRETKSSAAGGDVIYGEPGEKVLYTAIPDFSTAVAKNGTFPFYLYFRDPAMFWADNWYWILIVFILIIVFFCIPGLFLQIYLARWCRRRRRKYLFKQNTDDIDLEEGYDVRSGSQVKTLTSCNESSSDMSSQKELPTSDDSDDSCSSKSPNTVPGSPMSSAIQHPASSLPEADMRQQDVDGKPINSSSDKVIVIPGPELTELRDMSHLSSLVAEDMFTFPEHQTEIIDPDILSVATSHSDNGLEIGNEAIIVSNPIEKAIPRDSTRPPVRPRKSNRHAQEVSAPTDIPETRPRRRKSIPSERSKTIRDNIGGNSHPYSDEKHAETRRRNKMSVRKNFERKKMKERNDAQQRRSQKQKNENATESLMRAARSLEDILEAIAKLTKQYPIPQISPEVEYNREKVKPTNYADKDLKRKSEGKKKKRRSDHGEMDIMPKQRKNRTDDMEMFDRKLRRTRKWAKEQKKIGKLEDQDKMKRKSKRYAKAPLKKKSLNNNESYPDGEARKKIPTLVKEDITPLDKTKQERRRKRLERDLEKLRRYHNGATRKEDTEIKHISPANAGMKNDD